MAKKFRILRFKGKIIIKNERGDIEIFEGAKEELPDLLRKRTIQGERFTIVAEWKRFGRLRRNCLAHDIYVLDLAMTIDGLIPYLISDNRDHPSHAFTNVELEYPYPY